MNPTVVTAAPENENNAPLSATEVSNLQQIALRATDNRFSYEALAEVAVYCSKSLIQRAFGSDPQWGNYILNSWEYATEIGRASCWASV